MNGRKKEEREERKEGREGGKEIERKRNQEDREQLTEGMDRMRGTWDTVVREVVFAQNLDDEEPAIKPTPYLFPQVLSPCCVCGCVEGCTYSQRCDVELSWLMRNVCSKSWTSYRHSNCSTQFLTANLLRRGPRIPLSAWPRQTLLIMHLPLLMKSVHINSHCHSLGTTWSMCHVLDAHQFIDRGSSDGSKIKNLSTVWETQVQALCQADPLEKGMATHSNILACKIPWTEELGGLQGSRVRHDWVTNTFTFFSSQETL